MRVLFRSALILAALVSALAFAAGAAAAPGGPGNPRAAARGHLRANAARLGLKGDLADLRDGALVNSPGGAHAHFQQFVGDIPVEGAELNVGLDSAGNVLMVAGDYKAGLPALSTKPGITAGAAAAAARQAVGVPQAHVDSSALVVYADGPVALSWKVTLSSDEPLGAWEVFVDAAGGQLVASRSLLRQVTGSGRVFNPNPVASLKDASLRDKNDAANAVPEAGYSTVSLLGLDGSGYLRGQYVSASAKRSRDTAFSSSNSFNYNRSQLGFEQVMAYYHIDRTQRYIQSLGFTNVDNRQQSVVSNGTTADNSFYSPSNKGITLGTGGVDDGEDADVIIHEYGHSIQDNQVPGFGKTNEGGAMGEGFGDYLAFSMSPISQTGAYFACIAEWDATSYASGNPPCLRRLDSNKVYPTNIVNEVHADGEIWSRALYDIWNDLGKATADKLVIQSHFYLTSSANFTAGANAIITANRALFNSSQNETKLRAIFAARGIPVTI